MVNYIAHKTARNNFRLEEPKMNILVCVKQVPDTTEIKIDPVKNTLIRDGVPSIVNPFDGYALEAAARIKDKNPDTKIVVLSMGPPQATAALKECLAIAADKAYLVSGRTFGGSDTLATSYILSCVYRKLGPFDAVFCGKQAIDGDTGQVGPEMAEHLGIPQVTYAVSVEYDGGELKVRREVDDGWDVIGIPTPAIITVNKTDELPRMATLSSALEANRADIEEIHCADVADMDMDRVGLKGSATKVIKTFTPDRTKQGVKLEGKAAGDAAKELVALLADKQLIS